jgi:prepilin-type N-terminal cleavage/methylation domain-containing protein
MARDMHYTVVALENSFMMLPVFSSKNSAGLKRPRQRRDGFTLLETLVVVTIIAILVGLTAGVTGAISGSRGSTAVQQVAAFLDEARAKALTGEGEVMVAFATNAVPEEGASFRAVMICQQRPSGGVQARPFEPVSGWFYLPPGYLFADTDPADSIAGVNVLRAADRLQRVVLPGPSGLEMELPCIGFRELGVVSRPRETGGKSVLVAVAEGAVEGGRPKSFQGMEHTPDKCRWLAVQKNSGTSMILP